MHFGLVTSFVAVRHVEDQPAIDGLIKVLAARNSDLIARHLRTFHDLSTFSISVQHKAQHPCHNGTKGCQEFEPSGIAHVQEDLVARMNQGCICRGAQSRSKNAAVLQRGLPKLKYSDNSFADTS